MYVGNSLDVMHSEVVIMNNQFILLIFMKNIGIILIKKTDSLVEKGSKIEDKKCHTI